ncbi:MAG: NUDIX domain-containing protein [Anaeromicrobium sp.]|jgi:8-oxo-dGTP pyrophosphatase MutT (NUDIX family)|uniref:NUDIX hydrolase n=1 Tax=Anaeromicrobium sp. TaxID=1929132 RepID=UPI0025FA234E|nr:NUDIX domain-containing protein [Anaeromicrobium sp.]MCT4595308.1 NUDIX domain-containing protein [Anaeromicrobium sp.]
MRLLKKMIHKDIKEITGNIYERKAARGIILKGEDILLLYTKRYNDYSFPGGGVDLEENLFEGLTRELEEETGAKNIKIIKEYGLLDEYRSCYYEGYDLMHMTSYFYVCDIDDELGETHLEDYEISNGMDARWVNIHDAIAHNKKVIESKEDSMGLSIERETFVLELVAEELIHKK